jgi:DNA-binding GntR family transcriptional regulator
MKTTQIGMKAIIQRPTPLGSEVYEYILQQLVSLAIAPGERINIDQLARAIGVSQTPIREALSQLEAHRLVVKHHMQGYRAAPQLTRREFEDLTELRLLIEPAATAKASLAMTDEAYVSIESLTAEMEKSATQSALSSYTAFARLDSAFHALIAQESGNALLHEIVVRQHTHLHLFRLRFQVSATQLAINEHAAIIAALRARDPKEAAAAMKRHIEQGHARFRSSFE